VATNKIGTRTTEEYMNDYSPVYQPIYPLLMKNVQQHAEEVGQVNFKRASTVGDIRAKHILPKDTEMRQVAVSEGTKSFKKYFLGNQYTVSQLQSQEDTEAVTTEVLDENQKLADEMLSLGEGTSNGTVVNNGVFYSGDPNHVTIATSEIAGSGDTQKLNFHSAIIASLANPNKLAGEKLILFYGTTAGTMLNSLYSATTLPFRSTLQSALGSAYTIVEMPENTFPAGENGWIIVNLDRIKVHFLTLPKVDSAGSNDEKKYNWVNFLMGSMMVDVLAMGGITRKIVTFA